MHSARAFVFVCAGLLGVGLLLPRFAAADWPTDPRVNVALCTGNQYYPSIASDDAGGAIVAWQDSSSGNNDIYAQRIAAGGIVRWTADGVALCTATGIQAYPSIVADGAGGAIVTWEDYRSGSYDIYAQRISADGTVRWTADGVALCTATGDQSRPTIVSDGAGGAIVTWQDERSGSTDIYAQRISAGGTVQWTANGVALCTATGDQGSPTSASDGAGGAIVTWHDVRSGNNDIYAQRIAAGGTVQWTADGVALCTATGEQSRPTIVPDGAGGAIVTWDDARSGSWDICAQKISAGGTVQWTADGVALCTATASQYSTPTIVSDGAGGAIVTWQAARDGYADIHAQRISADGTVQWTADGVALCTATASQYDAPAIVADGAGGAIVTWEDHRSGNYDIYAQRISDSGTVQWTANGVALCTATGEQSRPSIVTDGAGGSIVTWQDHRSGNYDIYAQWISANGTVQRPANGVALRTATGNREYPTIVADGAGGAIVTWQDYRSGNYDIYAQRVSTNGTVQWTARGAAVCTATGEQSRPAIVTDGAGGAIITWWDERSGIYAQRISAGGAVQWTANGVALCTVTGTQYATPTIVPDGAGGAIVTWFDGRSGNYRVYAQRISAGGTVQWTADGVTLCTATGIQAYPAIVADGAGGAIVTWEDYRSGGYDIYAQRISAGGTVQWTADGVALCTATGDQYGTTSVSGGAGGAIVTWWDERSGSIDLYAQQISAGGTVQWTANGVALCTAAGEQSFPTSVADGAGGAIVTWVDYRGGNNDIYAQRISAVGSTQWTADGVALCTAPGNQYYPTIVSDGTGGAIVTWQDWYSVLDIYAQRISAGGTVQWTADGVALCSATGTQWYPTIVSDGAGGAIVTWQDQRSGSYDIYAQRVKSNGELGGAQSNGDPGGGVATDVSGDAALAFALDPMRPNPTRASALTVRFTLANAAAASLELLDVAGRRIAAREVGSLGAGPHALDLGEGRRLAPGLYLVCLRQGTNTRVTRVAVLN